MTTSVDQRHEIRRQLKAIGASLNELARQSGLHKTTVLRALGDNPKHAPSTRTLDTLLRTVQRMTMAKGLLSIEQINAAMGEADDEEIAEPEDVETLDRVSTMVSVIYSLLIDAMSAKLNLSLDAHRRLGSELVSPDLRLNIAHGLGLIDDALQKDIEQLTEVLGRIAAEGTTAARETVLAEAMAALSPGRIHIDAWSSFMHRCAMIIAEITNSGAVSAWLARASNR